MGDRWSMSSLYCDIILKKVRVIKDAIVMYALLDSDIILKKVRVIKD